MDDDDLKINFQLLHLAINEPDVETDDDAEARHQRMQDELQQRGYTVEIDGMAVAIEEQKA